MVLPFGEEDLLALGSGALIDINVLASRRSSRNQRQLDLFRYHREPRARHPGAATVELRQRLRSAPRCYVARGDIEWRILMVLRKGLAAVALVGGALALGQAN